MSKLTLRLPLPATVFILDHIGVSNIQKNMSKGGKIEKHDVQNI